MTSLSAYPKSEMFRLVSSLEYYVLVDDLFASTYFDCQVLFKTTPPGNGALKSMLRWPPLSSEKKKSSEQLAMVGNEFVCASGEGKNQNAHKATWTSWLHGDLRGKGSREPGGWAQLF
jgi:hypothetical protein